MLLFSAHQPRPQLDDSRPLEQNSIEWYVDVYKFTKNGSYEE